MYVKILKGRPISAFISLGPTNIENTVYDLCTIILTNWIHRFCRGISEFFSDAVLVNPIS